MTYGFGIRAADSARAQQADRDGRHRDPDGDRSPRRDGALHRAEHLPCDVPADPAEQVLFGARPPGRVGLQPPKVPVQIGEDPDNSGLRPPQGHGKVVK